MASDEKLPPGGPAEGEEGGPVASGERRLRVCRLAHARTLPEPWEPTWSEFVAEFTADSVVVTRCSIDPRSDDHCQPKECQVPTCSGLPPECDPSKDPLHRKHEGCRHKNVPAWCGATFAVDPEDGRMHRTKRLAISAKCGPKPVSPAKKTGPDADGRT